MYLNIEPKQNIEFDYRDSNFRVNNICDIDAQNFNLKNNTIK